MSQKSSDGPHAATRRDLLKAVPVGATALVPAPAEPPAERPNIVLIISDQFRWDCIGAMGLNPMNLTPNLDAMARQGVMFRSAFCNQPVCAPARASMFTGQYPSKHGVWKNESLFRLNPPPSLPFLPKPATALTI